MLKVATIIFFLIASAFDRGTSHDYIPSHGVKTGCPIISWAAYPTEPLDYGETPVRFEVRVSGNDPARKLKYTWFVSAGAIKSGQGTNSILVSMKGEGGKSLTATVVICGLPDECDNVASASSVIAH